MDSNNNLSEGISSIQQPSAQPVQPPQPVASPMPPVQPIIAPQGKNNKAIVLLVILLLLIAGMAAYILFVKNEASNTQKKANDSTSIVLPSPTLIPTLAPEDDLEVSSPEAELLDLETDVNSL